MHMKGRFDVRVFVDRQQAKFWANDGSEAVK
jgi:hypothetical protein